MKHEALILKLRMAQNGSCSCMTKTPEVSFHAEACRYRVLDEAAAAIALPVAHNFCPTCGKPTPPGSIHTCTPPIPLTAPTAQER